MSELWAFLVAAWRVLQALARRAVIRVWLRARYGAHVRSGALGGMVSTSRVLRVEDWRRVEELYRRQL